MKVYKAPFIGRGVTLVTPSSLPSVAGQYPSWNTNGTFAGWTLASPAGLTGTIQYNDGGSFGGIAGSSWTGGVLTVPTLAVTDLTATRIPYVGTAGRLVDNADLTWGSSTLTIDSSQTGAGSIIAAGDGARFRSLKRAYLQSIGGYSCFITPGGSSGISLSTSEVEPGTDAFVLVQGTVTTLTSGTAKVVYDVTRNIA